jgi:hypothetical protein
MGYAWDGACLAVAMPQSTTPNLQKSTDEWEDLCRESGFEYIDSEAKGRNEYGGASLGRLWRRMLTDMTEPVGLGRLKEAVETTDWTADESEDLDELDDLDDFDEDGELKPRLKGYDAELAEMDSELKGLKTELALHGADDGNDQDIEEMEQMMSKLQAIKGEFTPGMIELTVSEMGSSMPEDEKKKFTKKAVNDMMKNL